MSSSSRWPSASDYNTAIQNPQNCFSDGDLKQSKPTTNQLGLPVPESGNFAVVYQLHNSSSKQTDAVKCFTRPVTDQRQRYDTLSSYFSAVTLPSLVGFFYLPQGILVRGNWYPVVRMEWIFGTHLSQFVQDNRSKGQMLGQLAAQWRGVVAGLRGAHIAHGDLQHGNIIIDAQNQIRLVDYDGIYVPPFKGRPPGEVGHPNFQHPERIRNGYYDENADAFSTLVIYLSLLAVKTDASLWGLHNGDNLIFVEDDFRNAGKTPIWSRLKSSPDAEVCRLTLALEKYCQEQVAAVPDLETILQGLPPPPNGHPIPKVICPICNYVNDRDEIYCQRCGHQLSGNRPCPKCHKQVPSNAHFCLHCSYKL